MINNMEYVALLSGVIFGFFYLRRVKAAKLFTSVYIDFLFRSRDKFYDLYDSNNLNEDAMCAYLMSVNLIKSNADFLKLFTEARSSAYDIFILHYNNLVKFTLKRFLQIFILPSVIFLNNWYLYVAGISVVFVLLLAYSSIVNPRLAKYNEDSIITLSLSGYAENKKKAS